MQIFMLSNWMFFLLAALAIFAIVLCLLLLSHSLSSKKHIKPTHNTTDETVTSRLIEMRTQKILNKNRK